MRLGVFDSGLGGLVIAKAVRRELPRHDMLYLGDTLHVPYGSRSRDVIFDFTRQAVDYMFRQDCGLIVVACNTASASALRRIQQEYLPDRYPDRRVLGVIVPTLETAMEKGYRRLGLIGTSHIVQADIYRLELQKLDPEIRIFQQAAPLLVPMIEQGGMKWIRPVLESYLEPLLAQDIDCLLLGCTHYPYLKDMIREMIPASVDILSQDEIVPAKLADYLRRHPEIDGSLSKTGKTEFAVTDLTDSYRETMRRVYENDDISIGRAAV